MQIFFTLHISFDFCTELNNIVSKSTISKKDRGRSHVSTCYRVALMLAKTHLKKLVLIQENKNSSNYLNAKEELGKRELEYYFFQLPFNCVWTYFNDVYNFHMSAIYNKKIKLLPQFFLSV